MHGARHKGSTLTRISLSQIDNWPPVALPVYLSCLMAVMLYGLFCARSIDVPAVLASFYECNSCNLVSNDTDTLILTLALILTLTLILILILILI